MLRSLTRNGSPFAGLSVITMKEAADHMICKRVHLIMLLVVLAGLGAIFSSIGQIKATLSQDDFLFLRLFTTANAPLPSFVAFMGFLLPLVAIALGFDAINGEYNRRTMSRLLAQPIYRDAVLTGKFLGGVMVLAICLLTLWLLMTGIGILTLGLPPSGEEVLRGLAYLICCLAYGGVWLALAMLFSAWLRSPATSALAALSLWLVFTVFWPMIAPGLANLIAPIDPFDASTLIAHAEWLQIMQRVSPSVLYSEMTLALMSPETRSLGLVFMEQYSGAVPGSPLAFAQSGLLIWPHLAGLIAGVVLVFTLAYVSFQRQEVRS
jgi:ABC-2 type transport system permease protein